jgi:hypothetical protein
MERKKVDLSELVDICSVKIDKNLSYEERVVEYVRQIKNPYHFKCGKYSIKVSFNKNGPSFDECLRNLLWALTP